MNVSRLSCVPIKKLNLSNKAAGTDSKQAFVCALYTADLISKSNRVFHKQTLQVLGERLKALLFERWLGELRSFATKVIV